ncbi:MAG: hypothetical protein MI723_09350, partial [Caulobacterales bacterium]|nr:hypothetical protein [Caulobacterales bacterium]
AVTDLLQLRGDGESAIAMGAENNAFVLLGDVTGDVDFGPGGAEQDEGVAILGALDGDITFGDGDSTVVLDDAWAVDGQGRFGTLEGDVDFAGGDNEANVSGAWTGNATFGGGDDELVVGIVREEDDGDRIDPGGAFVGDADFGAGDDVAVVTGAWTGNADLGAGDDAFVLVDGATFVGTADGGEGVDSLAAAGPSFSLHGQGDTVLFFEPLTPYEGDVATVDFADLGSTFVNFEELTVDGAVRLQGASGGVAISAALADDFVQSDDIYLDLRGVDLTGSTFDFSVGDSGVDPVTGAIILPARAIDFQIVINGATDIDAETVIDLVDGNYSDILLFDGAGTFDPTTVSPLGSDEAGFQWLDLEALGKTGQGVLQLSSDPFANLLGLYIFEGDVIWPGLDDTVVVSQGNQLGLAVPNYDRDIVFSAGGELYLYDDASFADTVLVDGGGLAGLNFVTNAGPRSATFTDLDDTFTGFTRFSKYGDETFTLISPSADVNLVDAFPEITTWNFFDGAVAAQLDGGGAATLRIDDSQSASAISLVSVGAPDFDIDINLDIGTLALYPNAGFAEQTTVRAPTVVAFADEGATKSIAFTDPAEQGGLYARQINAVGPGTVSFSTAPGVAIENALVSGGELNFASDISFIPNPNALGYTGSPVTVFSGSTLSADGFIRFLAGADLSSGTADAVTLEGGGLAPGGVGTIGAVSIVGEAGFEITQLLAFRPDAFGASSTLFVDVGAGGASDFVDVAHLGAGVAGQTVADNLVVAFNELTPGVLAGGVTADLITSDVFVFGPQAVDITLEGVPTN